MSSQNRRRRVNVRALIAVITVILLVVGGAVGAYKVRKRLIARRELTAAKFALERKDWPEACKHLRQYLARCNDPEMLRRYADANVAIHPVSTPNIAAAVAAYRELLRSSPGDRELCAK